MFYRVRIDPVALRQIEQFAAYLRDYNEELAIAQIERLDLTLAVTLSEAPLTWSSNNVFTLFSGFDDDDSIIDNYWQDGQLNLKTNNLKRANYMRVTGLIQRAKISTCLS